MTTRRKVLIGLGGSMAIAGCTGSSEEEEIPPEEESQAESSIIEMFPGDIEIEHGEMVEIGGRVENIGEEKGLILVWPYIIRSGDKIYLDEYELELEPGGEEEIIHELDTTVSDIGELEYGVETMSDEQSAIINVIESSEYDDSLTETELVEQVIDDVLESETDYDEVHEIDVSDSEEGITAEASSNWMAFRGTESAYNSKAADVLEGVFESDAKIHYFEINLYAPTTDEYGNEGFSRALTVGMSEETANQINWDNYDSDNLSRHAETYDLNHSLF